MAPPPTTPTPVGTNFTVVNANSVVSLANGGLESPQLSLIPESGPVLVAGSVVANNHSGPVPVPGMGGPQTTIASGTRVCTYIVNWDPVTKSQGSAIAAVIDFGQPILGITPTGIGALASQFDLPGVVYGDANHSLLFTNDFLRSDGTVLEINIRVANGAMDQFRVITSC